MKRTIAWAWEVSPLSCILAALSLVSGALACLTDGSFAAAGAFCGVAAVLVLNQDTRAAFKREYENIWRNIEDARWRRVDAHIRVSSAINRECFQILVKDMVDRGSMTAEDGQEWLRKLSDLEGEAKGELQ